MTHWGDQARMKWVGHVAHIGERRGGVCRVLVGGPGGDKHLSNVYWTVHHCNS